MFKVTRKQISLLIAVLLIAAGLLVYLCYNTHARIEHHTLADGSQVTLAIPDGKPTAWVLLASEEGQRLADDDLLEMALDNGVKLVEFTLPADDCAAQQQRAQAAVALLSGHLTLVAGIGKGAAFAWRWLATQNNDNAQALSVGFSLKQPDCALPLPSKAEHGHWFAAWNNNPDDPSARFARDLSNAHTSISDYDTTLPELLQQRLNELLQGQPDDMPTIEINNQQTAETVTLFYSGDGGWRDLDKAVAEEMSARNVPVVGVDCLRYFWQHKSPEQAAADLSRMMQYYREEWSTRRFVLAGFSFGADVLPAIYNRLPVADQQQVDAILLMALARSGSFQVEVKGWLGQSGQEALIGPELSKLPAEKVLCVYGEEEQTTSGCTEPTAVGEKLRLPGGHHFDENYPALAERLLQAIAQRQSQSTGH
ncbi:AcvB/VirJ family lysyl-phosphatidylglycerol hydrolase [Ectopseudomonas mendocina]|uniref:AcvB/VirJ family lysyl-phosphatidylglycerol hydrolase n=1 Tax=Ectopseudomonas mendocina TaxID=300 RepID=A0ABZ2RCL7_ECTME